MKKKSKDVSEITVGIFLGRTSVKVQAELTRIHCQLWEWQKLAERTRSDERHPVLT